MTLRLVLRIMLALAALLLPLAARAAPNADIDASRRVMVMLRLPAEHFRGGNDYGSHYSDAVGEAGRQRLARRIARDHRLELDETWPMRLIGVDCVVMRVPDNRRIDDVVAELAKERGVAWSQPLNEFAGQSASTAPTRDYNDRLYPAQPARTMWHLAGLHAIATGRGQTIAVIDSGVDRTHPDLAGQVSSQEDFVQPRFGQGERHGTGVAGIIAARANNAAGIVGIAPEARIMALRACRERPEPGNAGRQTTTCDTLSLAKALVFAIEHHAGVVNLSLSGPRDRLIQTLVETGLARGATLVAAIDASRPAASFPAMLPGVVAVDDDRPSARLSAGEHAVYIAPGLDIPTTEPGGRWSLVNGTSFATAHVSGLAALIRQVSAAGPARGGARAFGAAGRIDACALLAQRAHRSTDICRRP